MADASTGDGGKPKRKKMNHSVIEIFLISSVAYIVELSVAYFLVNTARKATFNKSEKS